MEKTAKAKRMRVKFSSMKRIKEIIKLFFEVVLLSGIVFETIQPPPPTHCWIRSIRRYEPEPFNLDLMLCCNQKILILFGPRDSSHVLNTL